MKKRILKKIMAVMLIIITFITLASNNKVEAANTSELELYSKENIYCFRYRGYLYRSEFVVYKHNGKEYPAYCLNRELDGVSLEHGGYKVSADSLITNNLIWKAIINGYPYKTYQELGCNSEMEAFTATKLAVYDMMYNYNLNDFVPENEAGTRVVAAIKNISKIARNSNQVKQNPEIKIVQKTNNWEIDGKEKQYVSKKFTASSSSNIAEYQVKIQENIQGMKITDINNQICSTFKKGEEFKVLIPIEKMENQITINVNGKLETYPIYYGKAPSNLQNYAIAGMNYENAQSKITEKIPANTTQIEITKIDKYTKETLEGCQFLVRSTDGKLQYTAISDKNGKAKLSKVIPGEYIIKEEKAKDGYIADDKEVKLKISLNENYTTIFENEKAPTVIEKTVVVEKPVIVEKEVIVEKPVTVEKEVIVEKEVVIEKPVIVEKEVIVEKPVTVEKEVVVEKPVIVEKEVIVEKQVLVPVEQSKKLPKTGF